MRTEPELRPSPERLPDFDIEDELDFGRYGRAVVARWWLLLAGLAAGIVIGYLTTLGGNQVYQARRTISPGQPLSPTGSTAIQSLSTNPASARQIVASAWAQRRAGAGGGGAARAGRGPRSPPAGAGGR